LQELVFYTNGLYYRLAPRYANGIQGKIWCTQHADEIHDILLREKFGENWYFSGQTRETSSADGRRCGTGSMPGWNGIQENLYEDCSINLVALSLLVKELPKKHSFDHTVTTVHQLLEQDKQKQFPYCQRLQSFLHNSPRLLDSSLFTDEAWFYLYG
jgi:hypothetical protein